MSRALFRLFAHSTVFIETSNMSAIAESVSPTRTTYKEMRPLFGASSMSATVPSGPASARRADPSDMEISLPPFEGFGSTLTAALRSNIPESWSTGEEYAATVTENGQKEADAREATKNIPRRVKRAARIAPKVQYASRFFRTIESEGRGEDKMGKQGCSVALPNTKMAYISHLFHTSGINRYGHYTRIGNMVNETPRGLCIAVKMVQCRI